MSQSRSRWFLALAVLSLLAILIIPTTRRASAKGNQPPVKVNRDHLRVGDVIATGVSTPDGQCEFGPIEIETVLPANAPPRFLGVAVNEACELVVTAKWNGNLEAGPPDFVRAIRNRGEGTIESDIPVDGTQSQSSNSPSLIRPGNSITALYGRKTTELRVWSFGYGTPYDVLTERKSAIDFSWNGSSASLHNHWGSCYAATWTRPNWEWRTDGCTYSGLVTSGWQVGRNARGNYHCHDLPDQYNINPCGGSTGYYHSLHLSVFGRADGSSSCTWYHTGSVVLGPWAEGWGCY